LLIYSPYELCYIFGAKVRVPSFELPENDEQQVVESELMNREDYDRILEAGWFYSSIRMRHTDQC